MKKDHRERAAIVEKYTQTSLVSIRDSLKDDVSNIHCENLIGAITIPVGVAGPVKIDGAKVKREVFIPLATTEGALVASVNRGCRAITQNGGVIVRTELVGCTRGPIFIVSGVDQGLWLKKWLDESFQKLTKVASSTSGHLSLIKLDTQIRGKHVYVRFYYDTADAMGMNMATFATDKICAFITQETGIECLAVAGNYDTDKKASWLNSILGRGRRGWAEVTLSRKVVRDVLKSNPEKITHVVHEKCWGGSMLAGSLGFNAHFANIVAAFYAATGQDIAHVVEGSLGSTTAEVTETGELYFSIFLPDIMIGTVGGGTKLKTQTEARSITGAKTAEELTEVLLAAILAGELSLLASIASSTLASAHKKLGR